MARALFPLFLVFVMNAGFAQTNPLTEKEKAALDSMLKEDVFFNMVKQSLKPKSYFELSAAIGNSYFSVKNKRIDAAQLESKLVLTPSVSYVHKKGAGISAAAFLTSFNGKSDFYQFALTPSYSIPRNKIVSAALSYTRFFRRNEFVDASSPVQNDLFVTAYLKKPWIEPGISAGLSGGRSTTYRYIDTVFLGTRVVFTDTMKTTIQSFSVSAFIQHSFEYYGILDKDDGIAILPKLIVNAGSNSYTEKHYNKYSALFKRIFQRRKNLGRLQYNTSFEIQSLACSVDINYVIGKFTLEPQVYLDYYLPETTDKKVTVISSFTLHYTF